jgi:tRNA U34 5-carboxymethylaminomethyl modifying GTPase MnmE/TrmE
MPDAAWTPRLNTSRAPRVFTSVLGMNENRVVRLTGPGTAALAVVRLRGPLTGEFLRRYFAGEPRVARCVHGDFSDGQSVIDDAVVVLADDGNGADLNLHGSPWIVGRVIELAAAFGFADLGGSTPASLDAVDGDDVLQREMAAHLPCARSELALRILAGQPQVWAGLRNRFSVEAVKRSLEDKALWRLLNPPRVAVVGAPNVGKSTLANQLFGQQRSITADLAGTTRDWVGEYTNVNGLPILLLDTPGLRNAGQGRAFPPLPVLRERAGVRVQRGSESLVRIEDRPHPNLLPEYRERGSETTDGGAAAIEAAAISGSQAQIAEADLRIVLLDGSTALEPMQGAIAAAYPTALRVVNKCDLPQCWDSASIGGLRISAKSGAGLEELKIAIAAHFGCANLDSREPRWWTQRQLEILRRASIDPAALKELWKVEPA